MLKFNVLKIFSYSVSVRTVARVVLVVKFRLNT